MKDVLLYDDIAHPLCVMSLRKKLDEASMTMEDKVQVKQSPEVGETEPSNIQENGPLHKEVIQTATPSPRNGSKLKGNSTRAQKEDTEDRPADEPLQCTLNSLQKEHARVDWEVFTTTNAALEEESPASAQDKIPDNSSLTAEAVCPENRSHTETNTREHITLDTSHDNDEEAGSKVTIDNAGAEPSGEFSQNNEVLSVPNTQVSTISVVSQEVDKESPSW